jgi:CheY-like chemotaxis protein
VHSPVLAPVASAAPQPGTGADFYRGAAAGTTVLIVDDDFPQHLRAHGAARARQALRGRGPERGAALEILDERTDIDLVLMDIMMPVMNGYEAIAAIRTRPRFAELPIIAVTGKVVGSERERCLAAGRATTSPSRSTSPSCSRRSSSGSRRSRSRRSRDERRLMVRSQGRDEPEALELPAAILLVDDTPPSGWRCRRSSSRPATSWSRPSRARRAARGARAVVRGDPHGRPDAGHGRLRDGQAHPAAPRVRAHADHLRHRARPRRGAGPHRLRERAVDFVFAPLVPEILRAKVAVFVELFLKSRELERSLKEVTALSNQSRDDETRIRSVLENVADGIVTLSGAG